MCPGLVSSEAGPDVFEEGLAALEGSSWGPRPGGWGPGARGALSSGNAATALLPAAGVRSSSGRRRKMSRRRVRGRRAPEGTRRCSRPSDVAWRLHGPSPLIAFGFLIARGDCGHTPGRKRTAAKELHGSRFMGAPTLARSRTSAGACATSGLRKAYPANAVAPTSAVAIVSFCAAVKASASTIVLLAFHSTGRIRSRPTVAGGLPSTASAGGQTSTEDETSAPQLHQPPRSRRRCRHRHVDRHGRRGWALRCSPSRLFETRSTSSSSCTALLDARRAGPPGHPAPCGRGLPRHRRAVLAAVASR